MAQIALHKITIKKHEKCLCPHKEINKIPWYHKNDKVLICTFLAYHFSSKNRSCLFIITCSFFHDLHRGFILKEDEGYTKTSTNIVNILFHTKIFDSSINYNHKL